MFSQTGPLWLVDALALLWDNILKSVFPKDIRRIVPFRNRPIVKQHGGCHFVLLSTELCILIVGIIALSVFAKVTTVIISNLRE